MDSRYEPAFETTLAMRVCELEDDVHELLQELRKARTALKEYRAEHAQERAAHIARRSLTIT